ncbi:MAG: PilZ domain-containing protein [Candidatus Omnitrophica bacterium]|nr:hypothetical protein [bacterium]NUN96493.1 PilZ domain-containing protein [Candidatus Omnitrophota bacterium]
MPHSKEPKVERRAKQRHRAEIEISVHLDARQTTVSTRDLCLNGLSCVLPEPLSLFTKYRFRLGIPQDNGEVQQLEGEGIVVRVEEVEVGEENLFQTAFFFQHLDPGHLRILEEFLDRVAGDNDR